MKMFSSVVCTSYPACAMSPQCVPLTLHAPCPPRYSLVCTSYPACAMSPQCVPLTLHALCPRSCVYLLPSLVPRLSPPFLRREPGDEATSYPACAMSPQLCVPLTLHVPCPRSCAYLLPCMRHVPPGIP